MYTRRTRRYLVVPIINVLVWCCVRCAFQISGNLGGRGHSKMRSPAAGHRRVSCRSLTVVGISSLLCGCLIGYWMRTLAELSVRICASGLVQNCIVQKTSVPHIACGVRS